MEHDHGGRECNFLGPRYLLSLIFQLRDYVYMYRWSLPHRDEKFGTRDRLLRIYATAISLETLHHQDNATSVTGIVGRGVFSFYCEICISTDNYGVS